MHDGVSAALLLLAALAASVALIESLVANGSGATSPRKHFNKVQRAVENYLKGGPRVPKGSPNASARFEIERLRRSIEATTRLDASTEASLWRARALQTLAELPR